MPPPPSAKDEAKRGITRITPEPNKPEHVINWVISEPKYSFDDIILHADTLRELQDVVSYVCNKNFLFNEWGLSERFKDKDSLAVNLYGPPGTGKTMAAHAIAREIGQKLICVDYADIESKYVGETSKNLVSLFNKASETQSIIFFDEADALLSKRVTNMTSATDVSVNQTRSVLLTLLNDYRGVIIFATNFIQNFDKAFIRRIRHHIKFHLPDEVLRERLWRFYVPSKMPVESGISFAELAGKFSGVSASEIADAVFSAAISAANDKAEFVTQARFEKAIQSCINVREANAGVKREAHEITDEEAKRELGEEKYNQLKEENA